MKIHNTIFGIVMRILINTALLPDIYSFEYISVLYKTIKRIAATRQEHHFIFICEPQLADQFNTGNNIKLIKTKKRKRSTILWKYWYDVRIPALLRKHTADLFISPGPFCSMNTKLPQLLVLADTSLIESPSLFNKSQFSFLKNRLSKSVVKAKSIITFSQSEENRIINSFKAAENKIIVVPVITPEPTISILSIDKEKIKATYTEGREFFLYIGNLNAAGNILNLLKAFSLFKKRQQSNFKLVICGYTADEHAEYAELLKTYRYKADVILINDLKDEELTELFVSAYAFVYPVLVNNFLIPVMQAMQSNIPVIASATPLTKELCGSSALYVNAEIPQDIADNMMRIYKDEKLRSELIQKGKSVINRLHQENAVNEFYEAMQKAVL